MKSQGIQASALTQAEIIRDLSVVCKCRAVRYKTVRLAIQAGAHTLASIREKTTANTGCGNLCTERILEMIRLHKS